MKILVIRVVVTKYRSKMALRTLFVSLTALAVSRASSIADCPGYKATNIKKSSSSITADLTLAGTACNIYGSDIVDLKLLVENTGEYPFVASIFCKRRRSLVT